MEDIIAAASALGPRMMLVTSAKGPSPGRIGNLLVTDSDVLLAEHGTIDKPPNGPGDLVASVFLARLMQGLGPAKALRLATASVFEILARARKRGADELMLETDAASLSHPAAMVNLKPLPRPGPHRRA
jgi:pyridoxine kinase